jgi:hypothetical protein
VWASSLPRQLARSARRLAHRSLRRDTRSRTHLDSLALLVLISLAGCGQAGAQIGTGVLNAITSAVSEAAKGTSPTCPVCAQGDVCDKDIGRCISEERAAAQVRARRAYLERPDFEIPPDPCSGRCRVEERCEFRGAEATCVIDPPPEP